MASQASKPSPLTGGHARGVLKVFLGSAPGVGKTYKMLDEAHRRAERGTDVVVAFVECHGRRHTEQALDGLEVLPRLTREYRGVSFTELDTEAVLARRPQVAVVDELAHTNIPGGAHAKRWEDIDVLLDSGIDVLTTVNVQHLESLNDVVQKITGVPQRETVPDEVVRRADQIELVDMAPEGLRRRMAHGNVYAAEKVDAALSNYFRVGNLTALRELALLWLAGRVDEGLRRYRTEHEISKVWETRETVVVALTGGAEGDTLIRRAARIADRAGSDSLLAVHVARSDGLADANPAALARQRQLVESLGGTFHSVVGDNIPTALLDFARASNATQLVLGTSRRSALRRALTAGRGIGETTIELSGDIDVHMVTHEHAGRSRLPFVTQTQHSTAREHAATRRWAGLISGLILPPLLSLVLTQTRGAINLTSETLLFLALVVGISLLGGITSALVASVVASLLLNYYFIPPIHEFTISSPNNVLALSVFAIVAMVVAGIVDTARKLAGRAARATAEAETLSALAGSVLRGDQAVPALLARLRETFGMDSVDLVDGVPAPVAGEEVMALGADAALVLRGRPLPASDRRVLAAFAAHVQVALERTRLAEVAAEVEPVKAADRLRTALLAAVSHDLRTPLAVALASVSSLRSDDVEFTAEEQADLLLAAEESLGRLASLVENLLDMSRLQAGALTLDLAPTALEDVWSSALGSLATPTAAIGVQGFDEVPPIHADAPLLERVLANLVANALRHAPGSPLLVSASALGDMVQIRVVDRGPGLPADARERVFQPFQRLGDTDNTNGVGLGLALARGLTEAMGGTLAPEDTPGGGLTMVLTMPAHVLDDEPLPEPDGPDRTAVPDLPAPAAPRTLLEKD